MFRLTRILTKAAKNEKDRETWFWPFPERERALARLNELMLAPIDGRHVLLVADSIGAGTTTTITELMRRSQASSSPAGEEISDPRPGVTPPYLRCYFHFPGSLVGLAHGALYQILDPPLEEWPDLPNGRAAYAAVAEAMSEAGIDRVLFDELSPLFRDMKKNWRLKHYFQGIERFVMEHPVRALFEISRWQIRAAKALPGVWAHSDVVSIEPISDSRELRNWLAACDPTQCLGEYDNGMVKGLLAASEGNMTLMQRYAADAVNAVLIHGQLKDVVRSRMRQLDDVAGLEGTSWWEISDRISGRKRT